ncbi:hypothetical protein GFS60_00456 [Rhodococcus sp. WAY2]|nr:hypothetical protein GFS60_00456 [Rhodococcus sp. WAY2]
MVARHPACLRQPVASYPQLPVHPQGKSATCAFPEVTPAGSGML